MRGDDVKVKNDTTESKWIFKKTVGRELSDHETMLIEVDVLKVAVNTCFTQHTYKHGVYLYRHVGAGGHTGFQATGKDSTIRMIKTLGKLKRVLRNSGIDWRTMSLYVRLENLTEISEEEDGLLQVVQEVTLQPGAVQD